MLVTGAHHSRELTSISMNLYLVMKLCYGFVQKDISTMLLLDETNLFFIPLVNVDGFKYISDQYKVNGGSLLYIRKNRNDGRLNGYNACT